MKSREPLQTVIDEFVKGAGGELVRDIIGVAPELTENADYVFRNARIIAELKSLESPTFNQAFNSKMGGLVQSWADRGLHLIYGEQRIDITQLPEPCQKDVLRIIAKPLRNNIFRKANRQIGATKDIIGMPDAKGVLLVASDGNKDLQPYDVPFFLSTLIDLRTPDGTVQFPHIDAFVYFNPRMPAKIPTTGQMTLIWGTMLRQPDDSTLATFLEVLARLFRVYMQEKTGVRFVQATVDEATQRNLKFMP